MASNNLALIILTLTPFLFLLTPQTRAQSAPAPALVNLTAILEKGGQYTTLIRLLKETQQINQIQSQLNSTTEGFTVLAPTDNAFQNLKAGTINDLTDDQKVKLILYHVTPKYYSLSDLLTVSNPVRTQGSGSEGSWGLNFTGQGKQVNVSTGVVVTPVKNALRQQFPLAVYQVDKVLLPLELFGAKSPSPKSSKKSPKSAPSPKSPKSAPSPKSSKKSPKSAPSPKSPNSAPSPKSSPKSPKSAPSPKSSKTSPEIPSPASKADAVQSSSDNKSGAAGMDAGLGMVVGLGLICMGALS